MAISDSTHIKFSDLADIIVNSQIVSFYVSHAIKRVGKDTYDGGVDPNSEEEMGIHVSRKIGRAHV